MTKGAKLRVISALLLSYTVLWAAGGALSFISGDEALMGLTSYAGGFLASIAVMLFTARHLFEEVADDEISYDAERQAEKKKPERILLYAKALAVAVLLVGINFLYAAATGNTSVPDRSGLIFTTAVGVIVKPAAEEYLFRVTYLRTLITGGIKPGIAIIFQAILFALLHDAKSIPIALLAGILFGILALRADKKQSFGVAYISHAIYNGILYLILALI